MATKRKVKIKTTFGERVLRVGVTKVAAPMAAGMGLAAIDKATPEHANLVKGGLGVVAIACATLAENDASTINKVARSAGEVLTSAIANDAGRALLEYGADKYSEAKEAREADAMARAEAKLELKQKERLEALVAESEARVNTRLDDRFETIEMHNKASDTNETEGESLAAS